MRARAPGVDRGRARRARLARPSALVVLFSIDLGVLIACRSLLARACTRGSSSRERDGRSAQMHALARARAHVLHKH